MKISKICVLGGGTAGFFVTSLLERYREISKNHFQIIQVYSDKIDTIGVGESTLLQINDFFSYLDLKEEDWMKECDATYKTSIRFEDFYKLDTYFHYPFGNINQKYDFYGQDWFTLKDIYPDTFTQNKIAKYLNPRTYLNEKNKLVEYNNELNFNLKDHGAYHFNASKLSNFLKNRLEEKDITFINDEFIYSDFNEDGSVKSLILKNQVIEADLFIDCSGFKSLLLGEQLKEKFIDYGNTLINNKAIISRFNYNDKDEQLKNYTNCIALKNGWCWEIPLWNEMSVGYVHSNLFASEDEILDEFEKHCLQRYGKLKDYKIVNYKSGRYERGWVKNVVSVGLSYGFLEPLESTGIASILVNSFRLLEVLSKRDMFITNVDRDVFNYSVGEGNLDVLKNFIEMHYYLSSRIDSKYWEYVTNDIEYSYRNLDSTYRKFLHQTVIQRDYINHDYGGGEVYIIGGMNYSPYSKAYVLKNNPNEILDHKKKMFLDDESCLEKMVDTFPSTLEFLKDKIYIE